MSSSEKSLADFLHDTYDITIVEVDDKTLWHRPIYTVVTPGEQSKPGETTKNALFSDVNFEQHENRNTLLAAIVLEEYSLQGTNYPVTVQLFNGDKELRGMQPTRNKNTWSAVLIPGTQHAVRDKIMFEPPVTHIAVARELFPGISEVESERGVLEIKDGKTSERRLCVDSTDGSPSGAICPLGYMLKHSMIKYETIQAPDRNNKTRNYIVLSEKDYHDALARFRRDTEDARPHAMLTNLGVEVKGMDEKIGSFVLSMRLGIFFYDA